MDSNFLPKCKVNYALNMEAESCSETSLLISRGTLCIIPDICNLRSVVQGLRFLLCISYGSFLYSGVQRCIALLKDRLWFSGQSSWLQTQRFGFDSLRYQIF
jgi:hypothetical protein